MKRFCLIFLPVIAALAIASYGCATWHDIRVVPGFIHAGVQAGDTVEITTKDGQRRQFVVQYVHVNAIEGPSDTIPFSEIRSIYKRSQKKPALGCGAEERVGCSVPILAEVLIDELILDEISSFSFSAQVQKFQPACETHDFCYRHGFATYRATREQCDDDMYDEMMAACWSGRRRRAKQELEFCQAAAFQMYAAVRRHGEEHFQTTTSSYCEYREDR